MRHPELYQFRRTTLEAYIEKMIALLDEMDGDPDFEDDELEDTLDEDSPQCGRVGLIGVPA